MTECPSPATPAQGHGTRYQDTRTVSQRGNGNDDETLCVEEVTNIVTMSDETKTSAPSSDIYLDSGASNHVFGNAALMSDISKLDEPVCAVAANGNAVHISEVGVIKMAGGNNNTIIITNVRVCAAIQKNLLSVAQLVNRGLQVTFDQDGAAVHRGVNILIRAIRRQNMYMVVNEIIKPSTARSESAFLSTIPQPQESSLLWHYRLGHCDTNKIEAMKSLGVVKGIEDQATRDNSLRMKCNGCALGKSTRTLS